MVTTKQPRGDNSFERDKPSTAARDQAEASIEDLRQRGGIFVDAVRATRMAMAMTDPSLPGNPIVFANQSFLDLSGYSMEEVLGQKPYFMNGADTDPDDEGRFRQILDEDRDGVVETVQYGKDGRRFVATVLLSAFKNEAGQTVHHFLSWADVTRRVDAENEASDLRKTQAALRESKEKYRALFQSIDEGFALIEFLPDCDHQAPDFRFLEVNEAFERQTGNHDVTGKLGSEINPGPDAIWITTFSEVAHSGEARRFEIYHQDTGRWYDVFATRVGGADSRQVCVVFADTTERKEQGERSHALVTAGVYSVYRMSSDWRLMYQLDSQNLAITAEPIENWVEKYIPEADLPEVMAAIEQAIRTKSLFEFEHRVHHADGSVGWVLSRAVPLLGPDGEIAEWFGAGSDITPRKRTEEALRESEARLAAAFESVPAGLAAIDLDGKVIIANRRYREFLPSGIIPSRDPERGSRWRAWDAQGRLLEPSDYPSARALRGESVVPGQEMLYTDDEGRDFWTDVATAPTRDDAGHVDGCVCVISDITERKAAEAARRQSEERLRQFGEASQDVLWIRDAETLQWTYLTPAFEDIYGLTREEALAGNNYRSWIDLIVAGDRQRVTEHIRRVREGERVTFDYRIRRPADEAIRWLRNTDFPITNAEGQVAWVGGIGHDLTELRETELRLQTLMEGIPQLVWRATNGGHWTWSSPQWAQYTGQSNEASQGFGWLEALHPDDRVQARRSWEAAAELGILELEGRICHADSSEYRWFQFRGRPLRGEGGSIIEWLGTSTDIHDLRELQEQQQILVAELQHRTRNLMGVIRAMVDKTGRNSSDFADFRSRFRMRLDALARVQGLLSRLNEHDRVTFDELLQTELAALDGSSDQVSLNGPTGVRLRSSTVQTLAMALHELATNAVKYGALAQREGRLAIEWSFEQSGVGGKPWLHIDWRESGVNMPPPGGRPQGTGQGRELIEHALPYQLSARTSYELGLDGVHCRISVPVSESMDDPEKADG